MLKPGQIIQNYLIKDRLCEGGMGTIFLGFDTKLEREVILKSIALGQSDGLAKARFLREAHALSKLDHPNICRIYEYLEGEEEDYLVLERITGKTLEVILEEGCDYRQKLRLAMDLAQALTAAHKSGIVHRDLKPSNIMVSDSNQLKVLDFGLAFSSEDVPLRNRISMQQRDKLAAGDPENQMNMNDSDSDSSDYTLQGTLVGTIDAMSPEQANGDRVTVASDMYAFGLLLQRMFTGHPCYEPGLSLSSLLWKVVEADTLPAMNLDLELGQLLARLKAKMPEERPTAAEAFLELKRIQQRPLRRLRFALIAVVFLLVALAITKHIFDLDRAQRRSELARQEAEEITDFMLEVFRVSDPSEARGRTITARELLGTAAARLESSEALNPTIKMRMMQTVGEVYRNLGLYKPAESMLNSALLVAKTAKVADKTVIANSHHELGILLVLMGRYDEAFIKLTTGLELRERLLGKIHPDVADSMTRIGALYWEKGEYDAAEPYFVGALAIREEVLAEDDENLAKSLTHLGLLYRQRGDYQKAESLYRRSIQITEKAMGSGHLDLAIALNNLGVALRQQGRHAESERYYRRALGIQAKNLGEAHPRLASTLNNLALINWQIGRYAEASKDGEHSLRIRERVYGSDHLKTAFPLNALGQVRWKQGRLQEAEILLTKALGIWEAHLAPDNQLLAWPISGLAGVRRDQGLFMEAEELFLRALALRRKVLPKEHPDLTHSQREYAVLLRLTGRAAEAIALESID